MLQPISEIFIPGRGHTTAASYALVSSLYGIGGKVTIGAQLSALGMNVPLTLGHPSWPAPGSEDTELYQIPLIRTRGPIGAVRWT
jgi:hypothetical protein